MKDNVVLNKLKDVERFDREDLHDDDENITAENLMY